jgi:hypothetical protein
MSRDPEVLRDRGRSLEEEFFRREDARLMERLRAQQEQEQARQGLATAAGISDPVVLDQLAALGIRAETVTALSVVPLIEVAWADGTLDDAERRAILDRSGELGFQPGSVARAMLETWLARKPDESLLTAWSQTIRAMCDRIGPTEAATMKAQTLERARAVAGASGGGLLGLGSKVSRAESAMLDRLAAAFPAS